MTSHGAHISDPFIRMKIAGAVLPVYKLSNGNLSNETWNPNIDMVTLHHKGRIEINIPDGNEPFVYVVGEKASYKKTAKWGDGTLWGSGTLWNA